MPNARAGFFEDGEFDRYNIIDEADLAAAGAKRFGNGKQAANSEPSTVAPDFVTSSRSRS